MPSCRSPSCEKRSMWKSSSFIASLAMGAVCCGGGSGLVLFLRRRAVVGGSGGGAVARSGARMRGGAAV
eukprot:802383-Prymnesium_polylepis.1